MFRGATGSKPPMFAPRSHRSLISLAFSPLENTASFRDVPVLPMWRSQAVRQLILVPPCGGSNPPAPANRFKNLAPFPWVIPTLPHFLIPTLVLFLFAASRTALHKLAPFARSSHTLKLRPLHVHTRCRRRLMRGQRHDLRLGQSGIA